MAEKTKEQTVKSLRKSVTFTIHTTAALSDNEFIAELLMAEERINSRSKLRFHLQESQFSLEDMEKKIGGYKFLCRLAKIPPFLIENPEVFNPVPLTKRDIAWAKKVIKKYETSKIKSGK